jgi:hypothetical protein
MSLSSRLAEMGFGLVVALAWYSALSADPLPRRVALIVGVSHYEHASVLGNPINDANDMASTLAALGFEVEKMLDPDRSSLEAAVRRYGNRSVGADLSLFHYSGHALEAEGRNWLLPKTANISGERDLRYEAIDLNSVLEQSDGVSKATVVFLDACRDNPFVGKLNAGKRNVASRGLGRVDVGVGGMMVAFATSPGQIALDGAGRNSPFTTALLKHVTSPGLEVKSLVSRVTKDVVETTEGKQRPWQNTSLEGDLFLVPPPATPPLQVAQRLPDVEVVFWDTIKTSRDPADFTAYLKRFPNGVFVDLARNRLMADPLHAALVDRLLAFAIPSGEATARALDYVGDPGNKAMAVAPKQHLTWRTRSRDTAEEAATIVLESCQLFFKEPCALAIVNTTLQPTSGRAEVRDMPRTTYSGRFDPDKIPALPNALRRRADVASYVSKVGAKAAALHPWGRVYIATGAGDESEAEQQALNRCNEDPSRANRDGPCFLYATSDTVVLPERLTKPRPRP